MIAHVLSVLSLILISMVAIMLVQDQGQVMISSDDKPPSGGMLVASQTKAAPGRLAVTVIPEREFYRSAEVLNLTAYIDSGADAENAVVTAAGINGRMRLEKSVNLTKGVNSVSFVYGLPRCNVCGGISAGVYNLSCDVSYGDARASNWTLVRIAQ